MSTSQLQAAPNILLHGMARLERQGTCNMVRFSLELVRALEPVYIQ